VATKGGEIAAVGQVVGEATKRIDVAGQVVAPGFIDLHTHSDLSFLLDHTAQSKVRQGVTLELAGNCGSSFCAPLYGAAREALQQRAAQYEQPLDVTWTDFAGYLDALERARPALNVAVQVGHGTVRTCVLGMEARAPTDEELARMRALVAESLDAGAMGFSTGLYYAPGSYAQIDEVVALAQPAAARNKLYSSHLRDEADVSIGLFAALDEAIEVGRQTGVRVQISHVKCAGPAVWGRAGDALAVYERSRRDGVDVAGDQYPYTAASTSISGALFPRWALEGGREPTLRRLADAATRARIRAEIADAFTKRSDAKGTVIARFVPEPRYEGMSLAAIAEAAGCDPAEAAIRLYEQRDGQVILHAMREDDVATFAAHPLIAVGSDGSSLATDGVLASGKPHPRSYGTNPRFLARFVRERRLTSLEEAVRKMTALPASRLGLTRRGRLAPGFAADLVVFDSQTVADRATFEEPHCYPAGIPYVAVNGVLVIEHGEFTGHTPGRVIRGFAE
jgi:N-acyl-D-amino-acid deacylase